MKFLSIDTSTQYSVVVLSDENGMIFGQQRFFEKGRCEHLFSLIDHCLKKAKIKLGDIDFFGVGCGPGSFTGLRIGIAAVKAFACALEKRCFAFSSLDAIAFNWHAEIPGFKAGEITPHALHLCTCVDAKRENVYCRFFSVDCDGRLKRESEDLLLSRHAFLKRLARGSVLAGDALKLLAGEPLLKSKGIRLLPEKFWYPLPESVSDLTLESFRKNGTVDPFALNASYLYESDCQINKNLKVNPVVSPVMRVSKRHVK